MDEKLLRELALEAVAWEEAAAIVGALFVPLAPEYTRGYVDSATACASRLRELIRLHQGG